jgi:hypothetical protein
VVLILTVSAWDGCELNFPAHALALLLVEMGEKLSEMSEENYYEKES